MDRPYQRPLPPNVSLAVFLDDQPFFSSGGKWLHPLFELEQFLKSHPADPTRLSLHDTAAGLAAAALTVRMGIMQVHVNLISDLALQCYQSHGVSVSFDTQVAKLACRTEELLKPQMGLDAIYQTLRIRAQLVQGAALDIEHAVAAYGSSVVFGPLSLHIPAGGRCIITGENGCGKSTLLRCIMGQVPLREGLIKIGGHVANGEGTSDIPPGIVAYIRQEQVQQQFPISAREVVEMGLPASLAKEERRIRLDLALRRTGAQDLANRNYFSLSGGERQRVSLSRCLCQDAGVFLLDEPTTFLDSHSRTVLIDILRSLSVDQMPTIVLVSHDNHIAKDLGWETVSFGSLHD